jgi:hypothetical protein
MIKSFILPPPLSVDPSWKSDVCGQLSLGNSWIAMSDACQCVDGHEIDCPNVSFSLLFIEPPLELYAFSCFNIAFLRLEKAEFTGT